ncbi:MAG: MerR family transcriptional regulator, partial [Planctomycetota bacterium]
MFTTGQFSKLANVSKRLLHHYDEVDLFKPLEVDPNTKTRFYSMEQLPLLSQILALKELGVPLERVGALVKGGLLREELQKLLEAERKRIQSNLEREELRLLSLESRLRTLEIAESTLDDLVVKPVPALPALTVRTNFPSIPDVFAFLMQLATEGPELLGRRPARLFATNHCDGYEITDIDGELGWILEEPID